MDYEIVGLTTSWVTYTIVLHNRLNAHPDVKFGFFLGLIDPEHPENSATTAIYFDDVAITLIGYVKDEVAPVIYAADAIVEQNVVFNPLTGIMVGDSAKNPSVVITSATAGLVTYDAGTNTYTVDTSVVGEYVLIYTVTDIYGNETVYNRNLSVIVPIIL